MSLFNQDRLSLNKNVLGGKLVRLIETGLNKNVLGGRLQK
jgi:hypothetical protein